MLSDSVAAQVQRLGHRVVRVYGSGAPAQSVPSAGALTARPNWVVVADAQETSVDQDANGVPAPLTVRLAPLPLAKAGTKRG